MEYFTLSNGLRIPAVGSGTNTFAKTDRVYNGSTTEVRSAIKAGYRLFDTAEAYENEEAVGNGVIESSVGRENVFLCTKMSSRQERQMGRDDACAAIERSLSSLIQYKSSNLRQKGQRGCPFCFFQCLKCGLFYKKDP